MVVVAALARLLPERVAQGAGALLGSVAGSVLRIRRGTVDENLLRAFPEWTGPERAAVARATYRHLGREAMVLLRLGAMRTDEIRDRTEIVGEAVLGEALERGRGVVLLAGHLGNWELAGAALAARGIPLDVVGRRQSNPLFDRRIREMREGFGMRPLYRHTATRPVLKGLREGRVVALVADQNVSEGGIFVDFFGVPASSARGPGVIPQRTGSDLVFLGVIRLPGARARYRLLLEAVPLEDHDGPETGVRAPVQAFHSRLEAVVRAHPEQYFWFHRRWKTRPQDDAAGTP